MAATAGGQQGASEPRRYPAAVRKLTWTRKPAWLRIQPVPGDRRPVTIDDTPVGDIEAELWSPADGHEPLPLLISHDGPEMDKLGGLTHFVGAMIADGRLPATRIALLEPSERTSRYSADPDYAEALCAHVVPRLLESAPSDRRPVLMGASLGALAALHAEWTHPGTFAGLFLESGSYFEPGLDAQESEFEFWERVTDFVGSVLTAVAAPTSVPMSIVFGSSEENAANNRLLSDRLEGLGVEVARGKVRAGHTYTGWRALLDPHLTDLIARAWA
jgi:enterochelin esterase-like enzyme